jgi:hypothetical protein
MCDFCALGPADRSRLLGKFRRFLKRGGRVLFDVYSLNAFDGKKENSIFEYRLLDGFWAPGPYYGFLNTFKYDDEKVTLDKYTIVEKERTRTVYNWLQYFSQESLREELEKNGFKVEEFYSDVAGSAIYPESPEIAIVAKASNDT